MFILTAVYRKARNDSQNSYLHPVEILHCSAMELSHLLGIIGSNFLLEFDGTVMAINLPFEKYSKRSYGILCLKMHVYNCAFIYIQIYIYIYIRYIYIYTYTAHACNTVECPFPLGPRNEFAFLD